MTLASTFGELFVIASPHGETFCGMRDDLVAAVIERGGVITRDDALRRVSRRTLERAVERGVLVRRHPGVYVLGEVAGQDLILDRAVLAYAPGHALSHTSALRVWGLSRLREQRRHITGRPASRLRSNGLVQVHRRGIHVPTAERAGVVVVSVEQAVVESWPLLPESERRQPMLNAVATGLTTPGRLSERLLHQPRTEGVVAMRAVLHLVAEGCRSELELWGHRRVFDDRSLPQAHLQYVVATNGGRYILDRAYLDEMVGVELDGAAWHGSSLQRERDVRRDAALAAKGWLIVRFTHARLHADPDGCRAELAAILAARRGQLRLHKSA